MTTIMIGVRTRNSVVILDSSNDFRFREFSSVSDTSDKSDTLGPKPPCLAFDPQNPDRAYWGTFDNGFCKTDDRGQSWYNIQYISSQHLQCRSFNLNKLLFFTW
jgi:hypothetical protein